MRKIPCRLSLTRTIRTNPRQNPNHPTDQFSLFSVMADNAAHRIAAQGNH